VTLAEALAALMLPWFARQHAAAIPIETLDETRARIGIVAEESVTACELEPVPGFPLAGCVALVATAAKWESALWETIHSGARLGPAGERGITQLHRTVSSVPFARWRVTAEEWRALGGTSREATRHQMRMTARVLGWHAFRCRVVYRGPENIGPAWRLFSEYHRPRPDCRGLGTRATNRAESWRVMMRALAAKGLA
jgi:hypothetical protein